MSQEKADGESSEFAIDRIVEAETKAAREGRGKPRNEVRNQPALSSSAPSSSMFQLQVEQLLLKVRPDYERRMVKAEDALRKLKEIIERIPDRDAKPVCRLTCVRF